MGGNNSHIALVKVQPQWPFVRILVPVARPIPDAEHFFDADLAGPPIDVRIVFHGRLPLTRPSSPNSEDNIKVEARPRLMALPSEIRMQIWEDVLGGTAFHLFLTMMDEYDISTPRQLRGQSCEFPNDKLCNPDPESKCRGGGRFHRKRYEHISLLLTCKQIYAEAIQLLYSANDFIISDSNVLENLPLLLLPQRVNAIQSLRFCWHKSPYYGYRFLLGPTDIRSWGPRADREYAYSCRQARWNAIWCNMSEMKGLRNLDVILLLKEDYWESLTVERTHKLLDPMRPIVGLRSFCLTIPWPTHITHAIGQTSEFKAQLIRASPWAGMYALPGESPWEGLPCEVQRVSSIEEILQVKK